ncbi:MAG: hypothetical protein RSB71_02360 [Bacilli bacterium]
MRKNIVRFILPLVFTLVIYYFMLPPINLSAPEFWIFIFIVGMFTLVAWATSELKLSTLINNRRITKSRKNLIIFGSISVIILAIILINLFNMPLFNSKSYYERIKINEAGDFTKDVKPVDFNKLALLDKDSSSKLGDRVMGQMTDLVSQFSVSNLYTQINYKDDIIRVTPLEYAGLIKYFTNRKNGVEGYITVNSVTGESKLVRLEKGMKYMPSSMFFENLYRKLRLSNPTTIFGEVSFELDEEGNPFWIAQTLKYSGIGLKPEVNGIVMLNPITGESKKYAVKDVPTWVDHVYSANLIIEQVDDWGKYKNGFFNSIFGQKNVVKTTRGYNYLALNDDIYLYTGITSVAADQSNVGFILTNLRTKETSFYGVSGAEEYSAMASAQGAVQQMKYTATFPLLINLDNKPTYLLSLKDNAGLVKMYAFVDYVDYQKVVVTDASQGIMQAAQNYLGGSITTGDNLTKDIIISSIKDVVIDGTTYYYFKEDKDIYRSSIKVNQNLLPFVTVGDKVNITYKKAEVNEITKISKN